MLEGKGAVMRLDKYLKVSVSSSGRTVANEACDSGRVMLNDKVARASAEVKIGDVIEVAVRNKSRKGPCDERAGDDPQGRYERNV